MIFRGAGKIAQQLWLSEIISEDERELYQYAIFSIMSTIIPLIMVMIIGGILGLMKNGIVMIIPLLVIRKFSGGFHAKREWVCIFLSVMVIVTCIVLTTYCKPGIWLDVWVLMATLSIFVLSPVVSVNREILERESKVCKKIAFVITMVFTSLYFCLGFGGYHRFAVCIAVGIILTAVLQELAWVQKKLVVEN